MKIYNSLLKGGFLISAFLFNTDSFNYSGKDIPTSEMTYSPINITLDPGHTNETNFAKLPVKKARNIFDSDRDGFVEEYELTDIVADALEKKLENDPFINVIRTKYNGKYTADFIKNSEKNDSLLRKIATGKRLLKEPKSLIKDINEKMKIYNIGLYAYNNKSDLLISLHFNQNFSSSKKHRGFHLIISPANKYYDESVGLALLVSKAFQEKGHKISNEIPEDPLIKTPNYLREKGIAVRNISYLGDPRYEGKVLSIIIEMGWMEKYAKASDKEIKELSDVVYYSIQKLCNK